MANTSTTRTWLSEVRKADKDFDDARLRPVCYQFAGRKEFRDRPDPYTAVSTST